MEMWMSMRMRTEMRKEWSYHRLITLRDGYFDHITLSDGVLDGNE